MQRQPARRQREAKTDDSGAQRWCDVSTSPTTTGDTANRNDSDVTTYYNRQTTTDDTVIYGISDAHVNEVHSQVRYRYAGVYTVYGAYNNRIVPKRDGTWATYDS